MKSTLRFMMTEVSLLCRFVFNFLIFILFLFLFIYLFVCFGYTVQLAGSCFPDQGLNPGPWQWKSQILATAPLGNSLNFVLTNFILTGMLTFYTCSIILPLSRACSLCCSVTKPCLTLWDPMDCRTPSFPGLHCLREFAQIHVQWVSDAI